MEYCQTNNKEKQLKQNQSRTIVVVEKEIFDKETIEKIFNDYFVDIGPNVASKTQNHEEILCKKFLKYGESDLETKEIADYEIHKAFFPLNLISLQDTIIFHPASLKQFPISYF